MKPISFPEQTAVIAENQEEYLNLPAHRTTDGQVISCWKPTIWERCSILFGGRIWLSQLTFRGPVQPVTLGAESPFTRGAS